MPAKTKQNVKQGDGAKARTYGKRYGFALILAASIIVIFLSLIGMGPVVTIHIAAGISVFAVAYLMSQFIERIVEPFSESNKLGVSKKPIDDLQKQIKPLEEKEDKTKTDSSKLVEKQEELDNWESKRVFAIWGMTSFLGILMCFFTVGLFEVVGVSFQTLVVAGGTITGHTIDSILSGIIVGGGTKPLHDLIGYLEKASKANSQ